MPDQLEDHKVASARVIACMQGAITGGVGAVPKEVAWPRHRGSGIRNGSDTRGLTVSASHTSTAPCTCPASLLCFSLVLVKHVWFGLILVLLPVLV